MKRALGYALMVLGLLLVPCAVGLWVVAIWTHGGDTPMRLAGTGFVAVVVAAVSIQAACELLELTP